MDALVFLAVIACCAIVLIWYIVNAASSSPGKRGWLAVAVPDAEPARRYQMKERALDRIKPSYASRGASAAALAYAEKSDRADAYRHAESGSGYRPRGRTGAYRSRKRA